MADILFGYSESPLVEMHQDDDGGPCWDCGAPVMRECICSDWED